MSEALPDKEPMAPFGCGCMIAAIVTTPVFGILAMAEVLSDCPPDYPCSKSFPYYVLLPSLLLGGGVTLLVGGLVKIWRNYRNKGR